MIKSALLTLLMVFVFGVCIVKAQVTADGNKIIVKGKDYDIVIQIEVAPEGAKIPVALSATGRSKGKYLSHASNRVTLQDGVQGAGELFIIEKKFNRRVALACVGGESGKYLSHADGKVFLQNGYQGKGEEWVLIPMSKNKVKLMASGDEEGWMLTSKTGYKGQVYIIDKVTGDSEYWIIEPQNDGSSSSNDQICCNQKLEINSKLTSKNGMYYLTFQSDGNLVLYTSNNQPIWASNTMGKDFATCIMQGDGNLVIYNTANQPVWASNSSGTNARLIMQDDGNLVIYNSDNKPIWASNTNR